VRATYKFFVTFDEAALAPHEGDEVGRWINAKVFYHEMLHGQLAYRRVAGINWAGWARLCAGEDFAEVTGDEAADHKVIQPVEERYLAGVLRQREGMNVQVLRVTRYVGDPDAEGNRRFAETIAIPERFATKRDAQTGQSRVNAMAIQLANVTEVETPDVDVPARTVTVSGTAKGKDARVLVTIDPPAEVLLVYLNLPAPPSQSLAATIDCDCAGTTAPNLGGAATEQCLRQERALMRQAAAGMLTLAAAGGRIVSASKALCDSVTAGPAGWPILGGPEGPANQGGSPPAWCTSDAPAERCLPPP
jgi:hypothetical protein